MNKMIGCGVFFALFLVNLSTPTLAASNEGFDRQWPTLVISILARNKEHTLPYFLTLLDKQDYPKNRIALWIRSDHNSDKTIPVLRMWLKEKGHLYHNIDTELIEDDQPFLESETYLGDWPDSRFSHVISLREAALAYARKIWADYIFMVDADVFLSDPNTLKNLISMKLSIVSPMLRSDGLYSNFWGAMSSNYYYKRSEMYSDIYYRNNISCFEVPMVHTAVLINLRSVSSLKLTYDPNNLTDNIPFDDIIAFAVSANKSGTPLNLCNDKSYGFMMVPLGENDTVENDHAQILNLKVESAYDDYQIEADAIFKNYIRSVDRDKMNMDEVYMINLKRRPNRRIIMERSMKELGLEVKWTDAVDGSPNMWSLALLCIMISISFLTNTISWRSLHFIMIQKLKMTPWTNSVLTFVARAI